MKLLQLADEARKKAEAVQPLLERARADGWTVSYETDQGSWLGIAARGKVKVTANGDSIAAALMAVLEKTHLPNLGSSAPVIPLWRGMENPRSTGVYPPCYGQCGGCERDCPA